MNRYIAGGLLAAIVVLLGSGIDSLPQIMPNFGGSRSGAREPGSQADTVGTQPIEQAGRVVQRQGQSTVAAPNEVFNNQGQFGTSTAVPQDIPAGEIRPDADNVIPRPGAAPQATTTAGDVSPIQPDLVQPGDSGFPSDDPDLDSIPALW